MIYLFKNIHWIKWTDWTYWTKWTDWTMWTDWTNWTKWTVFSCPISWTAWTVSYLINNQLFILIIQYLKKSVSKSSTNWTLQKNSVQCPKVLVRAVQNSVQVMDSK